MNFCTTRHSSLILCCLDFIFLKAIPALKDKLNNNAANEMVIWKQVKSVSHLQLVSNDVSIQMKKHHFRKHWQNYAKTRINQPARKMNKMVHWTSNKTPWPIVHEQIAKYNMKIKTGKGSSLLKPHQQRFFSLRTEDLSPEARKVWTEIDELKSEEELTTELRKLWYLKNSAK